MSSAGGSGQEAVDVRSLLNELVVLWTRIPSALVTLHLLFSEPMLTAIINANDLQVTTDHSGLDIFGNVMCCYSSLNAVSFICPYRNVTTCSSLERLSRKAF